MALVDLDTSRKYNFSDESEAHYVVKNGIYNELMNHDDLDKLFFDIEHVCNSGIVADLGGYHDGKLLAVEIVHTHEDYKEYCKKVKEYHKEKIHDFWIYTEESIRKYIDSGIRPSAMMLDLQKRFSRIYYYSINDNLLHGAILEFKNGNYEWIVLPNYFDINFNSFVFAESKYHEYICKEEQYALDFNLEQTKEFIRYNKEILESQGEEIAEHSNNFLPEFKFQEGVPVKMRFIEVTKPPHFKNAVLVVEIDGEKRWVGNHKVLRDLFEKHLGHELSLVTQLGKRTGENGYDYFMYSGEII